MADNEPFRFDPEDMDRLLRGASEQLRGVLGRLTDGAGGLGGWTAPSDQFNRRPRPTPEPETAGEAGDGVWSIFTTDSNGGAHVEQVYATELDALRANKHNTDANRRVRFLPYGIDVSVLDAADAAPSSDTPPSDTPPSETPPSDVPQ